MSRAAAILAGALLPGLVMSPAVAQRDTGNKECYCNGRFVNFGVRPESCETLCGGGSNSNPMGSALGAVAGMGAGALEDQLVVGVAGMAVNSIMSGFFQGLSSRPAYPDPAQEAQRQRILELERQQQAERDAARRRKFLKERDELLNQLMGRKFMEELRFKALGKGGGGGDLGFKPLGSKGGGSGDLGFKPMGSGAKPAAGEGGREMQERRKALEKLKGKPQEEWCRRHIVDLLCPVRPIYDMGKLYESRLAYYRSSKQAWDQKCGGPSAKPGYTDQDDCGNEPARPAVEAKTTAFLPVSPSKSGAKAPGQPATRQAPPAAPAAEDADRAPAKPEAAPARPEPAPQPAPSGSGSSPGSFKAEPSAPPSGTTAAGERSAAPGERTWRPVEGASHPPSRSEPGAPALRDKEAALAGSDEQAKAAGAGGFDAHGPMLGKQGRAPEIGRSPEGAGGSGHAVRGFEKTWGGLANGARGTGAAAQAGQARVSSFVDLVSTQPRVAAGRHLIGDPNRFRAVFHQQTGETCAEMAVLQLLADRGVHKSEYEVFVWALENGYFADRHFCGNPFPLAWCSTRYDPEKGSCYVLDGHLKRGKYTTPHYCTLAAKYGATRTAGVPEMLQKLLRESGSKDEVAGAWTSPAQGRFLHRLGGTQLLDEAVQEAFLSRRAELESALKRGRPVLVTVDGPTLWGQQDRRKNHSIVVTAAVMDGDRFAGYYINDSGSGEHGRLVPPELFEKAWKRDNLQLVYVK